MNDKKMSAPAGMLKFGDIMYVVFRHKWKITIVSLLGVIIAAALYFVMPPSYFSEAKLLVRYVLDAQTPIQEGPRDSRVKTPDDRGDGILGSEIELLTSTDVAKDAAEKLLDKSQKVFGSLLRNPSATNVADVATAVAIIHQNLEVEVIKHSSVIRVAFTHQDRRVPQPLLTELVDAYLKKSSKTHSAGELDDTLTGETVSLKSSLTRTEQKLFEAKTKADVVSLEDAKKSYTEQLAKIRQQLFDAKAELAGSKAWLDTISSTEGQNLAGTNGSAAAADLAVPPAKTAEYKRVCDHLVSLDKEMDDRLKLYTPTSKMVQAIKDRIDEVEHQKEQLESDYPGLLVAKANDARSATVQSANHRLDVIEEKKKNASLDAKVKVLEEQEKKIQETMSKLNTSELSIADLQRQRDMEEARYKRVDEATQRYQLAQKLSAGQVANIGKIQEASPPAPAASKLIKIMAMVLVGSVASALAFAFLIEFYFDQSLRRPADVETSLGLPLFMSIPRLSFNGKSHELGGRRIPLLAQTAGEEGKAQANGNGHHEGEAHRTEVAVWDPRHTLRPYHDALRDRLITYFEMNNLTHKPKLVAVTSCAEGSGVSTVAAGLAAALSETGDGNVLLVDMNQQGSARQFFKGDLACGLEDALTSEKRGQALVQENLYVVNEIPEGGQVSRSIPMPRRFKHLVPRLRASDYDYIIFDVPPVSQTSVTPRLARFVDMVLMVVESERTDRELVKKASQLLAEVHANVGIVMNKGRTYLPKRLQQELS
jgi:uncharacterized protein involved in exopolysaccharide biosynthesis/Mrp family chromosome partitioning ATPase